MSAHSPAEEPDRARPSWVRIGRVGRQVRYGLVCCWLLGAFSLQAATGLIGSVSTVWGEDSGTVVEVTNEADASKQFTGGVDFEGIFRFPNIPPGKYSIKITAIGVRGATLHGITLLPGVLKDVGNIHLIAPCEESPNMICAVGGHFPVKREESGNLEMIDLCGVDLYEQTPECIVTLGMRSAIVPEDGRGHGFWFHSADDGVYLVPLQGVAFSLNPPTVTDKHGCVNAAYAPGRIRIDNLPPGSRACVSTRWGRYAELIFTETIKPGQGKATVKYVLLGSDPNESIF
jgi:hypothetical protein